MSKTTKRNIILVVVAVLLAVFVSTIIGTLSNGYENIDDPASWGQKDINPDNLIKVADYSINTQSLESGIDIVVDDDGRIKVQGENKTTSDVTVEIVKVTVPAGTYTFTSGVSSTSASKYFLKANGYYADFNNNTFELASETTLTISLNVKAGEELNVTFAPVLVAGDEAGTFYID